MESRVKGRQRLQCPPDRVKRQDPMRQAAGRGPGAAQSRCEVRQPATLTAPLPPSAAGSAFPKARAERAILRHMHDDARRSPPAAQPSDPEENAEWREALASLLQANGAERVREIMDMLAKLAMRRAEPT